MPETRNEPNGRMMNMNVGPYTLPPGHPLLQYLSQIKNIGPLPQSWGNPMPVAPGGMSNAGIGSIGQVPNSPPPRQGWPYPGQGVSVPPAQAPTQGWPYPGRRGGAGVDPGSPPPPSVNPRGGRPVSRPAPKQGPTQVGQAKTMKKPAGQQAAKPAAQTQKKQVKKSTTSRGMSYPRKEANWRR